MSEIQLRDYQEATINQLFENWRTYRGEYNIVSVATGGGKTVIAAEMIRRCYYSEHMTDCFFLFLAHRKELLTQSKNKIQAVDTIGMMGIGIYAASLGKKEIRKITVASRDSLGEKMLDQLRGMKQVVIIIDEAHNVSEDPESRYRKIVSRIEAQNERVQVVGLTATPWRGAGRPIFGPHDPKAEKNPLFQHVIQKVTMRDLIRDGHLVPVRAVDTSKDAKIDVSGLKITSTGDFSNKAIREVSEKDEIVHAAVSDMMLKAVHQENRQHIMIFCVSVDHATAVQKRLKTYLEKQPPVVTGETKQEVRDRINAEMLAGQHRFLINVGVYVEGTDFPLIDCIVLMRPIGSSSFYLQAVGRGMRPSPATGKTDCLLLDYGGCIERHGPIDQITWGTRRDSKITLEPCEKCHVYINKLLAKCPHCGDKRRDQPHKTCPDCGEVCPPTAGRCPACKVLFARHDDEAATGSVMSDQPDLRIYEVEEIRLQFKKSRKSGKPFLCVEYVCAPPGDDPTMFNRLVFTKNLMLGWESYAGQKAEREWYTMVRDGTPRVTHAMQAVKLWETHPEIMRAPRFITVNHNTKHKDITRIVYEPADTTPVHSTPSAARRGEGATEA